MLLRQDGLDSLCYADLLIDPHSSLGGCHFIVVPQRNIQTLQIWVFTNVIYFCLFACLFLNILHTIIASQSFIQFFLILSCIQLFMFILFWCVLLFTVHCTLC